jgi:photosystem II stability/assembly factor-like uncharacterized protein
MKTNLQTILKTGKLYALVLVIPFITFTSYAQTWGTQATSLTDNINGISFIKGTSTGYAVADGGRILKTTNAGLTWTLQNSGTVRNLNGVHFTSKDTGYAVGDSGVVIATKNAGSNWTLISSGTTEQLNDVKAIGTSGFIVGDNGVILKLSSFSVTTSNSGSTDDFYGLHLADASTAIVVGGSLFNSSILATYNSGSIWVPLSSGALNQLNDVFFVDDSVGYIVGNAGTILKSSDHGANWTSQTTATTSNLNAVYFMSGDSGYAVGATGTVIRTTNGSTWTSQASGAGTATLTDISFSDKYTGYASGNAGTIIKTCPYAAFNINPNDSICVHSTASFSNQSHNSNAYHWIMNGDTVSTAVNFSQMQDSAGTYVITLTADNGTCTSTTTQSFYVADEPTVDLGPDTSICSTCTVTLNAGNIGSTYKWYRNGTATGVVSMTNTVGLAGTYVVQVTSPSGCMASDTVKVTIATGLSSIGEMVNDISVYPNPNNKNFTVNFVAIGKQNIDMNIINYMGMSVYSEKMNSLSGSYSKPVSLEGLAAGVYFVNLSCEGKTSTVKMIIF